MIQQLIHIADGWYTVEEKDDHLVFSDLRFGQFGMDVDNAPFIWAYHLYEEADGSIRVERSQPNAEGFGKALEELADRIKGN